jgi:hypothetical protein
MRLLDATESMKSAAINLIRNMRPDLATVSLPLIQVVLGLLSEIGLSNSPFIIHPGW